VIEDPRRSTSATDAIAERSYVSSARATASRPTDRLRRPAAAARDARGADAREETFLGAYEASGCSARSRSSAAPTWVDIYGSSSTPARSGGGSPARLLDALDELHADAAYVTVATGERNAPADRALRAPRLPVRGPTRSLRVSGSYDSSAATPDGHLSAPPTHGSTRRRRP
jgi:hypothetical protein